MSESVHPLAQILLDILDAVSTDGLTPDELEQHEEKMRDYDWRRRYARVSAIERDHFPALSVDELSKLGQRIRTEISKREPKPAHRLARSKAEREKRERLAHNIYTALTSAPLNLPSGKADELTGLFLGVGKRTAQSDRQAHARRVRQTTPPK